MNICDFIDELYLNKRVEVTCAEGYLGTEDNRIEGFYVDSVRNGALIEICIAKSLCEPVDGEYTWIDIDAIEEIGAL